MKHFSTETFLRNRKESRASLRRQLAAMGFHFSALLASPLANPKIEKGIGKVGVMTFPMHLAPSNVSGFNTCASASPACIAACLDQAGNPISFDAKRQARINRTLAYFKARPLFLRLLKLEMLAAISKAKKAGFAPAFRLNATSDIRWESVRFDCGTTVAQFAIDNGAEIYDYTKHANRRHAPAGYHLTFSWAGDNESRAIEAFDNGLNVAIPFNTSRNKALPAYFKLGDSWVPVFDGDNDNGDFRPLDPTGHVIGLRFKFDTSPQAPSRPQQLQAGIDAGFVIDATDKTRARA